MATDPLVVEIARMFDPPPQFSVSAWADAEVFLPEHSARRGARYNSRETPYLVEPMDAATVPGVKRVVLQKSSQVGASTMLETIIGFHIAHKPRPLIVALPTGDAATQFMKDRIGSLARRVRAVGEKIYAKRSAGLLRQPESTLSVAWFAGGYLAVVWSGSPQSFAQRAAYLVAADDADRMQELAEGDPITLLERRTVSFHDGRAYVISTPTLTAGRIDTLYRAGDQRRWHVRCPACSRADFVTWNDGAHWRVVFDEKNPVTARLECPGCGHAIREAERMTVIRMGRWVPTNATAPPGCRSYHIWAVMSPFVALPDLVAQFLEAKDRRETLQSFVNTVLGEPWTAPVETLTLEPPGGFMSTREPYDEIPMAASLVTGAIDVQDDRFECLFVAWGPRDEAWVLDHLVLAKDAPEPDHRFDPYAATDWARLYTALFGEPGLRFQHASGVLLPISTLCVDSGYQTALAYRFSRFNRRVIFPTKGVAALQDGHLIKFSEDHEAPRHPERRGVSLVLVNTGDCKQRLADRIQDGRLHFPVADWCDEAFFDQLTAEAATPIFNPAGVRIGQKWIKQRARNEVLDLLVLNLAARAIRGTWNLAEVRRSLGLPTLEEGSAA